MRVEFEFDRQKVEALGYTVQRVYDTIKRGFREQGLRCAADDEILAFTDNGGKEDFSHIWILIDQLINTSWFAACVTACRWYSYDDGGYEDVLAKKWMLKREKEA